MLILFVCTKAEMEAMNQIQMKMDQDKLKGEKPDFIKFMNEVDKKFSNMDILWILSDLRESLRKIKKKIPMQSPYN